MKKVLLKSMLLFVAILFVGIAQAQTVTGTVTEEAGPLPGANVIVKGTSNGTTTDFDGNYTLNDVGSNATLVFSYVGFTDQEIAVNGQSVINVTLAGGNELDEVVLIGYGTTTVKDATGSVASVTAEDFNQGVIQSPEQLLTGKASGVLVSESSGEPGAGININIRGNNSIRSGNNPLFVVDGIPLTGAGGDAVTVGNIGAGGTRNPLNFLNPNDIESISILKDASATAIYGTRGANGVVIIKTKGGRGASKGVFELTSSISYATPANRYDLANASEFLEGIEAVGGNTALNGGVNFGADEDYQDFYTRTALSRNNTLSYSKSYGSGNLRASLGYSNVFGVVENTGQERIAGRLNITQKFLDDKLTLSGNVSLSRLNDEFAPISAQAGSTGDLIGASITANPTIPISATTAPISNQLNPANLLATFFGSRNTERLLANVTARYQITDNLSGNVTVGYDKSYIRTLSAFSADVLGRDGISGIGRGNYNINNNINSLLSGFLEYDKDFDNVKLNVIAGYEYQEFDRNGVFANAAGFNTTNLGTIRSQLQRQYEVTRDAIGEDFINFGYGNDLTYSSSFQTSADGDREIVFQDLPTGFQRIIPAYVAGTFDNADELQSGFVRANVEINDKFLITGTARYDGSTVFGPDNRYEFFPSGAVAWKLDQEDFVGDNISTLKLRLGAGVVGSQDGLGFGLFLPRFRPLDAGIANDLNINNIPGVGLTGNRNPDLKWEETSDYNLGIDFGFNDDRFNGSFNLYRKETRDLLLPSQLAAPTDNPDGVSFQNLTDGVVINQGVELSLNYDFIQTDDWGFSTSFNIAYNQNEVQDLDRFVDFAPINGNGLTNAFAQRIANGQSLFSFFMAEFTGFDANGFPTYRDINGDGVGDENSDKFFVGEDALPDVTAGLSLSARYKNFDLSANLAGQFGFSVYNATDNAFYTPAGLLIGKNVPTQVISDVVNGVQDPSQTVAVSSRFLEKGDFVRLQSASLGYNWPMSGEGAFDSLRLSFTGQNLFIITGYSGLDPEISSNTGSLNASNVPSRGIDYAAFPRPKTYTLGVNVTF